MKPIKIKYPAHAQGRPKKANKPYPRITVSEMMVDSEFG